MNRVSVFWVEQDMSACAQPFEPLMSEHSVAQPSVAAEISRKESRSDSRMQRLTQTSLVQ
jgi:hypothetical protein